MTLDYQMLLLALERDRLPLTAEDRAMQGELARFVFVHAKAIVRDETAAADVAQKVLAKVVRALLSREFVPGESKNGQRVATLEQWLAKCAANGARDALRSAHRERWQVGDEDAADLVSPDPSGDEVVDQHQLRTCLYRCLSTLSDVQRWLLVQHFAAGLSETSWQVSSEYL
jgi:DNA-directed RNA polymerase specialized sigma24 family protein